MNPNATLAAIRQGLDKFVAADDPADIVEDLASLAEAVDSLDTWLTNGGFLPTTWRR